MEYPELWPVEPLFARLRAPEVLVVGDVILDHYLHGRADRISPEAPVPVICHESEEFRLGGAANVALNLRALGAGAHLIAAIGQDEAGQQLQRILAEADLPTEGLLAEANRMTTQKTRVLARGQQLLRYDRERIEPISAQTEQTLCAHVEALLQTNKIGALLFQDYDKGLLSPPLIGRLIGLARQYGVPTITDPKRAHFWAYRGVTLFKPNLREVSDALGANWHEKTVSLSELAQAANQIHQQLDCTYVVITLGARGLFWSSRDAYFYLPTRSRQVADVCGAGDTVVSLLALGLAAQLPPATNAVLANLAGGQVCERIGVVPVEPQQLQTEYEQTAAKLWAEARWGE